MGERQIPALRQVRRRFRQDTPRQWLFSTESALPLASVEVSVLRAALDFAAEHVVEIRHAMAQHNRGGASPPHSLIARSCRSLRHFLLTGLWPVDTEEAMRWRRVQVANLAARAALPAEDDFEFWNSEWLAPAEADNAIAALVAEQIG